ncbi:MAG: CRISPR-associated protein Cas4 [Phycisphaerae bacterium]|nr:CRISPR-associated protein Cas4 [Phycisphaerales bacterium]
MYHEDDLLPISALQHLLFCERQCALIHIEGLWAENRLTVEGQHLHRRANSEERETRRTGEGRRVRILRSMMLRSMKYGLTGVADLVELLEGPDHERPSPFPIEYKRGKPKRGDYDRVQLCAQALCLEEMLDTKVPAGAIFYARTRRREEVALSKGLRKKTIDAAQQLHAFIRSGATPIARKQPKCRRCSLFDLCMPDGTFKRSASAYLKRSIAMVKTATHESADDQLENGS